MRCMFDSRNCTGEPGVHLRRIIQAVHHPDSRPDRVVLIVTESEPAGEYCPKHAHQLCYGEIFAASPTHP